MHSKLAGVGSVEERLRLLERALNFNAELLIFNALDVEEEGTGGGSGGADHTHVFHDAPTGSGSAWTLSAVPTTGTDQVFVNGLELRRVGPVPGPALGEYTIAADAITLGFSLTGTDRIWAHYLTPVAGTHTHVFHDTPSGARPGTVFMLAATPTVGTEQIFLNGMQQRRIVGVPSVNEYSIIGDTITMGLTVYSIDSLVAHYVT